MFNKDEQKLNFNRNYWSTPFEFVIVWKTFVQNFVETNNWISLNPDSYKGEISIKSLTVQINRYMYLIEAKFRF